MHNCSVEREALAGIRFEHNRRYGADCAPALGPFEIATEIAAPHQNEGPHQAAGLRARSTANRSGARGTNHVLGRERPTIRDHQLDPERLGSGVGPLPFPATAMVCGEGIPLKTSLRRAKSGRGLDRYPLPAKTNPFFWEGGMGALAISPGHPCSPLPPPRWSAQRPP